MFVPGAIANSFAASATKTPRRGRSRSRGRDVGDGWNWAVQQILDHLAHRAVQPAGRIDDEHKQGRALVGGSADNAVDVRGSHRVDDPIQVTDDDARGALPRNNRGWSREVKRRQRDEYDRHSRRPSVKGAHSEIPRGPLYRQVVTKASEPVCGSARRLLPSRRSAMDKRTRVLAALRGEAVDRVPISFWGHHYVAENSADGLAQETLRQLQRFDWDFVKPQSRAQAFAEMWGLTYTPSRVAHQKYTTTHVPVAGPAELARLQPADPTAGALGEQLQALRTIRAAAGPSVPIIWTVFSPLMIARYLLPGDAAQLLEIARTEPDALTVALEAIAETLVGYVRACLASGADGVFYATNLATREMLSMDECARFQRPYDLRVLAQAVAAPFNVMHICRQDGLFDAFADYPVAAFSWALGPGNPSLAEAHRSTGRAVMGGIPAALGTRTATDVAERVQAALVTMARRWLLLAPDCSIDIATPDEVLLAARDAARGTRSA